MRRVLGSGSEHDRSEDLVQEVLARVLGSLQTQRFAGHCALSTWVTAIARRVALEELEARASGKNSSAWRSVNTVETVAPIDVERQLEARRALDDVESQLASMAPETARVVALHDMLGYELAEVAGLMELSVTAAQARLSRGRRALVRNLKRECTATVRGPNGQLRRPHGSALVFAGPRKAGRISRRRPDSECADPARGNVANCVESATNTNACSCLGIGTNEGARFVHGAMCRTLGYREARKGDGS